MYSLIIRLYTLLIRLAALFGHSKARRLLHGQSAILPTLHTKADPTACYIWCHAASAGEFEQGKPLLEAIHRKYPGHRILLTFFSPSGYEQHVHYSGADIVTFFPFDTPRRIENFLDSVNIVAAIFIKYEVWGNCLAALRRRHIPAYLVCAVFRHGQLFFHRYGRPYARLLARFDHIFVQDEDSRSLLHKIGITAVTVAGDTRFDRVVEIRSTACDIPAATALQRLAEKAGGRLLVAGSTWPIDDDILIPYINTHPELYLILAPHEIDEAKLRDFEKRIHRPIVRLSATPSTDVPEPHCILVDTYGQLASLYRYGRIAYIGGGFSEGIHNTLEAAVYGNPLLFGPNYHRFREARELVACGGAFPVNDYNHLEERLTKLFASDQVLAHFGRNAAAYVEANTGATARVLAALAI
jgi:3-deoxy-D-manno-octulosonic-acid transferase